MTHAALWRVVGRGLMFAVLAQGRAWAQKPAPAEAKELVAVLEMDGVGAGKAKLAAATEELCAQLVQSGRFRVVDRQQIDALLKEQAFQQTGCTTQECAVQVGKIPGVRKIVTRGFTKISETLWQAAVQMVDVESAETPRAVTVNQRGAFEVLLGEGLAALTAKLTGGHGSCCFPRGRAGRGTSSHTRRAECRCGRPVPERSRRASEGVRRDSLWSVLGPIQPRSEGHVRPVTGSAAVTWSATLTAPMPHPLPRASPRVCSPTPRGRSARSVTLVCCPLRSWRNERDTRPGRTGADRVRRGGGWDDDARSGRCSYRRGSAPSRSFGYLGFRLARRP